MVLGYRISEVLREPEVKNVQHLSLVLDSNSEIVRLDVSVDYVALVEFL